MCTAIFDSKYGHFFGRTLDLEYSLGQEVVKTERGAEISFIYEGKISSKFAFMGMAHKARREDGGEEVPLYFDGMNECGLSVAALNFFGFAHYAKKSDRCRSLASFEVIPYILSNCGNIDCVKKLLYSASITADHFSTHLPPTPLHFFVADKDGSIVIEQTTKGLKIYDDPVGVMTNSPPFDYHMLKLAEYSYISPNPPEPHICNETYLHQFSRGLGAIGLPGDFSSSSRFVRAVFLKNHTRILTESLLVNVRGSAARDRFFNILSGVSVPLGCIMTSEHKPVCTVYTSVCDMDSLAYHYFTYSDREIKTIFL